MKIQIKEFMKIPGVGKNITRDFIDLGFSTVPELRGRNPQRLFDDLCNLRNELIDRCVLYVFRGAVYFAGQEEHKPELLKWWNWQDKNLQNLSPEELAVIHVKPA